MIQTSSKKQPFGAGAMAHQLRALPAPAGDLSLDPNTHMRANNCLKLQFQGIQSPPLASVGTGHAHIDRYIDAGKSLIHEIKS